MRVLLNIEMDTASSNEQVRDGSIEKSIKKIMAQLKPEAAYFYPRGGNRGITLVVDAPDSASLIGLVEPFWLELNARVEAFPCLNAEELQEGLGRLG